MLDAQFREVLEVIVDPMVVIAPDSRVAECNRAFLALFPKAIARKITGQRLSDLVTFEGGFNDVGALFQKEDKHVRLDHLWATLSDGTRMRVNISAVPVHRDAAVAGYLMVMRDVSDFERVQNKYQQIREENEHHECQQRLQDKSREWLAALAEIEELRSQIMAYRKGLKC